MRGRLRDQFFYLGMALFIGACYSALLGLGFGRDLHARFKAHVGRARNRVRNAQQRVTRVGASFVELLRSAV
jgi:hypothetical protein